MTDTVDPLPSDPLPSDQLSADPLLADPLLADPMWSRFRELQPDVTLVLFPALRPTPSRDRSEPDQPQPDQPEPVSETSVAAEREALEAQTRTAVRSLGLSGETHTSWIARERTVRARVILTGMLEEPLDGRTIAFRLSRLGWDTVVRRSDEVTWVEGTTGGWTLTLWVVEGRVTLQSASRMLPVTSAMAAELLEDSRG